MSSSVYEYCEETYDTPSYKDIYISERLTEKECLGEVYLDGEKGHADLTQTVETSLMFTICKEANQVEKGLVSGWANVAKNADGSIPLDWQGDVIDPGTLEDAAIEFMKNYRESGTNHTGDAVGIVVESIVLTKDKQKALGIPEGIVPEGWFITVQLNDDDAIAKVKSGEYAMFSIQGTGERIAL